MKRIRDLTIVLGLVATASIGPSAEQAVHSPSSADIALRPTEHPRLPADPSLVWMAPAKAPAPRSAALAEFAAGVKLEVDGNFARALTVFSRPLLHDDPLGDYATYYRGLAELRVGRIEDARRTFRALEAGSPVGYLAEAAALREAECAEEAGDLGEALAIYERLSKAKTTAPEDVLMRMGRAARAAGDPDKALAAFSTVYYDFPLGDFASAAAAELDSMPNRPALDAGSRRYAQEVGRAEHLFASKRYGAARVAFESLKGVAQGDDRELAGLRIAESDYFLKRAREARDGLAPFLENAARRGEASYFYASALRELGERGEYVRLVRRVADDFPTQTWAEDALNDLATHYIVENEDDKADEILREMYERFPTGHYAERAAWRIGWHAYRGRQYAETVRVFEYAAAQFPRSDYRPPWLYWSARAHEAVGEAELAAARDTLVTTDYLNSYYGRLALGHLSGRAPERRLIADVRVGPSGVAAGAAADAFSATPLPPNQQVVRALLALGLYDQATDELHYAQKAWGNSSPVEATLAWIYEKQGQVEKAERQFGLYRAAINTMKRAYPQFMAAGGEALPKDVLKVIFPLGYWDLIRKYAAERELDPYLVAALMAQESTFVPGIVSYAKAVGLMQIESATARQYARKLGMRYSSSLLTNPESNIKLGTAILADDLKRFGELHLVLASYNAGPGAVRRWLAERDGLPRDEFIDDIPYAQTQGYVKKILGTAEDYRRLYGPEAVAVESSAEASAPAAASRAAGPRPAAASSTKRKARAASPKARTST